MKRIKGIFLIIWFLGMATLIWNLFDKSNPLNIYGLSYPIQYIRASLEASDLKPHWEGISKNRGDCRIQNTIAAIKNPDLYIVFGKVYDPKTGVGGNHQWTTSNPENPNLHEYITDNTTGITKEKKERSHYIPHRVYKLDVEKCKLIPVRQFKELTDEEKFLVKSGEFYVEIFCRKIKSTLGGRER